MPSSNIPLYRVQGTHYECARDIGVKCRERIQKRITNDQIYLESLFNFVQTDEGHKLHQGFIDAIRTMFPWYWDEIRGLADGSEIPLELLLVLNFVNETRTALRLLQEKTVDHAQQETGMSGTKGCSTVLINRKDTNTFALLHNEDNTAGLYDTAYLVEADIKSSAYNGGTRHSPNERFVAYCYAGVIPGNAFGTNMYGFVVALNALHPNYIGENRIPRQILNRALLSVVDENELDKLLHETPIAYGFCINGGFFRADNNQQCYLLNYELGPNLNSDDKMINKNFISKCLVLNNEQYEQYKKKNDDDCIALNYLLHYNHYERLQGSIVERAALLSSRNRARRGLEFGEIRTEKDALTLLGDQADEKFPIFIIPETNENNAATLCTVHFNFHTYQLIIYRNNPKDNSEPHLVYNLANLWKQNDKTEK
ncbi:unnamed protein product [Rotaria sp. Silwood1]|nr:unnamed protein product [Rotaria sp. Silwood1]CAF3576340.1 unnamed protein product [Rotaria sp. Silwood1]CAF3676919.1 unnamed protein product [Rotaria sp. Silwood1]CAF4522192.1 unnamed protein product [Rotaria sp. Silwood1]CAF4621702.1 unnamed protein product [Rotaria sp. Silwood1]